MKISITKRGQSQTCDMIPYILKTFAPISEKLSIKDIKFVGSYGMFSELTVSIDCWPRENTLDDGELEALVNLAPQSEKKLVLVNEVNSVTKTNLFAKSNIKNEKSESDEELVDNSISSKLTSSPDLTRRLSKSY
jgi:hypothetical protein